MGCVSTRVTQAVTVTRVELPTIDEDKIGTIIMKKYINTVE